MIFCPFWRSAFWLTEVKTFSNDPLSRWRNQTNYTKLVICESSPPPPARGIAKADTLHPTIYVQLSHDADRNIENYVLIIQRSFKIFPTTFRYSILLKRNSKKYVWTLSISLCAFLLLYPIKMTVWKNERNYSPDSSVGSITRRQSTESWDSEIRLTERMTKKKGEKENKK